MWHRKFSFLTKYKDVWSSNRSILRRSSYVLLSAISRTTAVSMKRLHFLQNCQLLLFLRVASKVQQHWSGMQFNSWLHAWKPNVGCCDVPLQVRKRVQQQWIPSPFRFSQSSPRLETSLSITIGVLCAQEAAVSWAGLRLARNWSVQVKMQPAKINHLWEPTLPNWSFCGNFL